MSLDITLLFQLVNFLITVVVLNFLIIRPILDILTRRRDRLEGLRGDAASLNGNAAHKLESYEAGLAKARLEIMRMRDAGKNAGQNLAQAETQHAMDEARDIRKTADAEIKKEKAMAMDELRGRLDGLTQMAISKVLG